MPQPISHRPPISTRHALALAFDLAVRRDPFHSILVPVLLCAPWAIELVILPPIDEVAEPSRIRMLRIMALLGDFITFLVVGAMLRWRARSVFNTPAGVHPWPAAECYIRGLRRIPWLLTTELVRNVALAATASLSTLPLLFLRLMSPETLPQDLIWNVTLLLLSAMLLVPPLMLSFRLGVATESVVLHEHDLVGAFKRSFRMMSHRFERWFELIVASAFLVLGVAIVSAVVSVAFPAFSDWLGVALFSLLLVAVMPVIQYAWTFFYLRLVEIDEPVIEAGPTYASRPGGGEVPAA